MILNQFLCSFLFIYLSKLTVIYGIAGRCYLCSQETLAECVGSNQIDSPIYTNILQYYTEPCNGQCVLFRNEQHLVTRGCSWTYGHMTPKSMGWHDISPGISAYFCDTYLCNNGTFEQIQETTIKTNTIPDPYLLSPTQLYLLASNVIPVEQREQYSSRQFHQCYSCTARYQGCGEFLDPHYARNYIRPCLSSCVIFRNPNDLNLITRDCSTYWPQVNMKSGLHKLLGADAFFCQESLCNGISFDFLMGIFHNQLPVVIKYPPTTTTTTTTTTMKTTINIYNDDSIWDDPDLDFPSIESTTKFISNTFHPTNQISPNKTKINDQSFIQMNSTFPMHIVSTTTQLPTENDDQTHSSYTTSLPLITRFEYLSDSNEEDDNEDSAESDFEPNAEIEPVSSTILPSLFDFLNNYSDLFLTNSSEDNQLIDYMKSLPVMSMPPFSWMLNMARENLTLLQTSTIIPSITTRKLKPTTTVPEISYDYCKNKECQYGGRLNSDCLCICLPTFTGEQCETVLCEQEPTHICTVVLEHECKIDYVRYLCPKFCQMDACSSS